MPSYTLHFTPLLTTCSLSALTCVTMAHAEEPTPAEPAPTTQASADAPPTGASTAEDLGDLGAAVTLNAAGFGFFGPSVNGEFGKRATGYVTLRPFGLGYLSRVMFVEDDDTALQLDSFGAGLGGRYYLTGEKHFEGVYVGATGEMLFIGFDNDAQKLSVYRRMLVVAAEGGYRHRFDRFLVGGGARIGYASELSNRCEAYAGESFACQASSYASSLYGEGVVDVGITF